MVELSLPNIFALINGCFCIFIAVPLLMHNGYKYYLNRNDAIFIKRHSYITVIEVVTAIIKFLLNGSQCIIIFLTTGKSNTYYLNYVPDTLQTLANICYDIINYLWLIRFFLLSFDLNMTNLFLGYEWQRIINPQNIKQDSKLLWYLAKKASYGNWKWVSRLFLIVLVICIINDCIASQLAYKYILSSSDDTYNYIQEIGFGTTAVPQLILVIIYFTIPKVRDNFYISGELKRIFMVFILYWMIFGSQVIGLFVGTSTRMNMYFSIDALCIYICDLIVVMITTYWVNMKVSKLVMNKGIKLKHSKAFIRGNYDQLNIAHSYVGLNHSVLDSGQTVSRTTSYIQCVEKAESTMQFVKFLADRDKFNLFVIHIVRDLSINQLLAFVEIIQYQQYIYQKLIINSNDDNYSNDGDAGNDDTDKHIENENGLFRRVKFYGNITESWIVYQYEPTKRGEFGSNDNEMVYLFKCKAHKLFLKYIEYGSFYEIDIKQSIRIAVITLLEHPDFLDEDDWNMLMLLRLFENIAEELFQSLVGSFIRFKKSKQFQKISELASVNISLH